MEGFRCLVRLLTLPACLALSAVPGLASAGQPRAAAYSFGVAPTLPAARLEAVFAPIGGELGRALGAGIEYRSATTSEKFAARLALQEFDIAHIHPFDYARIAARQGYLPVARRNGVLTAEAVVREDSAVRKLKDLRGARIAMPPQSGPAAYLGRALLAEAGLDPAQADPSRWR